MGIKVKKKKIKAFETQIYYHSMLKDVKKNFGTDLKRSIADEIGKVILSGTSPVKGKQFKQYTEKYGNKKYGGPRKPVNMLDSGKMLESLTVKQNRAGDLIIWFKDKKKAAAHHFGLGHLKGYKRRLLPTNSNEQFKEGLMKKILAVLKKAVKKSIIKAKR